MKPPAWTVAAKRERFTVAGPKHSSLPVASGDGCDGQSGERYRYFMVFDKQHMDDSVTKELLQKLSAM